MSTTVSCNGRMPRKQLSDQLDRLDGIIDILADALPEAVRDAVREGTQAALQQLMLETLQNPATMAQIRQAMVTEATPPPVAPSGWSRLRTKLQALRVRIQQIVQPAVQAVTTRVRSLKVRAQRGVDRVKSVVRMCRLAWHLKQAAVIGLAVGGTVTAVALISHPVATILSGIGATFTAFAVQMALWCRRTARPWLG